MTEKRVLVEEHINIWRKMLWASLIHHGPGKLSKMYILCFGIMWFIKLLTLMEFVLNLHLLFDSDSTKFFDGVEAIINTITMSNICLQTYYLSVRQDEIEWCFNNLQSRLKKITDPKDVLGVNKEFFRAVTLLKFCAAVCSSCMFIIIVFRPLLIGKMSLSIWSPIDITYKINFLIIWLQELIVSIFGTFSIAVIISLTGLHLFLITNQVEMLEKSLRDLKNIPRKDLLTKLNTCIEQHQFIINYARKLNDIFGNALFADISLASIHTCVCVFLCLKNTPTFINLSYNVICMIILLAIPYAICWGGRNIQAKSKSLSDALFDSGWEDFSPELRRLLIPMFAANNTLVLKSKEIFIIDMVKFKEVIERAYSLLTIMLSMDI